MQNNIKRRKDNYPRDLAKRKTAQPKSFLASPAQTLSSDEDDYSGAEQRTGNVPRPSVPKSARSLHCHRVRFVDYTPASISSLALSPPTFNPAAAFPWCASGREILAVGRGNGDIEILVWIGGGTASGNVEPSGGQGGKAGNKQTWVTAHVLPSPKPSSAPVEHLTWVHRGALTPDELELFDTEEEQIRETKKLQVTLPRLFSASGSSEIHEWTWSPSDPSSSRLGSIKRRLALPGGAVCSLSSNPAGTKLAAAVEDGSIHLVDVVDDEFNLYKTLEKATGSRALSMAWGPESNGQDQYIVTGCTDSCLRKWDVRSGRCTTKMTLDKVDKKAVLVWSVAILNDHNLISGDSSGRVTFWDGRMGTQNSSIQAHKSDVLCLSIAHDGKAIYSSGSDQATCQFTRTLTSEPSSSRKTERWHLTNKRRVHQHDVRALACSPSYHPHNTIKAASILLSGGLDMSIMITPCGDERPHEMVGILSNAMNQTFATGNTGMIPYVPQSSVLSFSRSKRLILLRKHTGFAVWKIGNGKTGKTAGWTKVAEVQLKGKTNTTLGSISGDGQWILIGDLWRTGIWRLAAVKGGSYKLTKYTKFDDLLPAITDAQFPSMTSAAFSDDSNSIAFSLHNASPDKPAQLVWISLEADTCSVTHSAFIDRQASTSDSRILAGSAKSYGSNGKANGHANGKANGVPADLGRAALDTSPEVEEEGSSSDQHSDSISEEEKTSSNSVRDIVKLAMSPNKRWLAFGDRNRSLHVYDLQKKQYHCSLPSSEYPLAALSFLPNNSNVLVVGLLNNVLYIYDVERRGFASWADNINLKPPVQLLQPRNAMMGIAFEPLPSAASITEAEAEEGTKTARNAQNARLSLVIYGADYTLSFRIPPKSAQLESDVIMKRPEKRGLPDEQGEAVVKFSTQSLSTLRVLHKYKMVLGLDFLQNGELCVVERPFMDILPELPPAFYTPRYGTG